MTRQDVRTVKSFGVDEGGKCGSSAEDLPKAPMQSSEGEGEGNTYQGRLANFGGTRKFVAEEIRGLERLQRTDIRSASTERGSNDGGSRVEVWYRMAIGGDVCLGPGGGGSGSAKGDWGKGRFVR